MRAEETGGYSLVFGLEPRGGLAEAVWSPVTLVSYGLRSIGCVLAFTTSTECVHFSGSSKPELSHALFRMFAAESYCSQEMRLSKTAFYLISLLEISLFKTQTNHEF